MNAPFAVVLMLNRVKMRVNFLLSGMRQHMQCPTRWENCMTFSSSRISTTKVNKRSSTSDTDVCISEISVKDACYLFYRMRRRMQWPTTWKQLQWWSQWQNLGHMLIVGGMICFVQDWNAHGNARGNRADCTNFHRQRCLRQEIKMMQCLTSWGISMRIHVTLLSCLIVIF